MTGTIPQELTAITSLDTLFLNENSLGGSVPPSVCVGNTTFNGMNLAVDCDEVACTCCQECGADDADATNADSNADSNATGTVPVIPADSNVNSVTALGSPVEDTPVIDPFPFVDNATMMESIEGLQSPNNKDNDYGCQTIDVGFPCYTQGWSIDFEISNTDCGKGPPLETYDLVALYPYTGESIENQGAGDRVVSVGTQKPLSEAVFWASSCGLAECDGVIANGQIYYRNTHPKQTGGISQEWWPVVPGTMLQLHWIRVDTTGSAIVVAESRPFIVANRCF